MAYPPSKSLQERYEYALQVEVVFNNIRQIRVFVDTFEPFEDTLIFFVEKVADLLHHRHRINIVFWVLPQRNQFVEQLDRHWSC